MAHRLSRGFLATLFLLLAVQLGAAQSPGLPPLPPGVGDKPKPPEPAPAAKELSAQEIDGLIEKAFGKDSAELKRPIRMWLPDIGMAIAAEKASVAPGGLAIRCTSASLGSAVIASKVIHGEEIVIIVEKRVTAPANP